MTDQKIRVGVAGLGIGRSHLEGYQCLPDLFDVVAVADLNLDRARETAEEFHVPRVYASLDDLCAQDDLEVIDICTPSFLHAPNVRQVVAAGKNAISEKPVAGSLKEVDELIALEQASGCRIMPIFQYRFGHGAQKLKLLIEAGVAGRPYLTTVETAWRRRPEYYAVPWRGKWATELGGPIVTLAIHNHDLLTYLLGPARRVFAHAKTLVNAIETEDTLTATVEMADGSLASLAVTTGSSHEISRHRFCFSGLVAESNTRPYTSTHEPWTFIGDTPEIDAQIQETLQRFEPLPERFPGQFYRFYHALRDSAPLPVTLQDARASLELITALYYSVDTGQDVELPIGPDHPYYGGWAPQEGS
ncbi:MAG: Gfo/Idh/MocA family oxidoreductase [Anaerolineae bacterium]